MQFFCNTLFSLKILSILKGNKIYEVANLSTYCLFSKMISYKPSVEPGKLTLASICSSSLWPKSKHTCIIQSNQVLGFDWFFPLFWLFLSIYVGFHLLNHGIVSINCLCAPKIEKKIYIRFLKYLIFMLSFFRFDLFNKNMEDRSAMQV